MGIGPIEAIPAALRYAGLKLDDLGWIELNEAFAASTWYSVLKSRNYDAGEFQADLMLREAINTVDGSNLSMFLCCS